MYQAATQVKVLRPVIFNVGEVEAFHCDRRQHYGNRYGENASSSSGLLGRGMVQDGIHVNLGDPENSYLWKTNEYLSTSPKRRGEGDASLEVGLTDSTQSMGKPCTRGSGQRCCVGSMSRLRYTQRHQ